MLLLLLHAHQVHLLSRVWAAETYRAATHERQVLELCVLQVHLCVWSDECAGHARAAVLVCVVCTARHTTAHSATLQGQVSICE